MTRMDDSRTTTKDEFAADRNRRLMASGMQGKVQGKTFVGANWRLVDFGHSRVERCGWQADAVNFTGSNFYMAGLHDVSMSTANFQHTKLAGASFTACDLSGASFDNAQFEHTGFVQCDFRGAKFSNSKLKLTDFRGCNLRDADFSDVSWVAADLRGADLRGATGVPSASELIEMGCKIGGAAGITRHDSPTNEYKIRRTGNMSEPPMTYSSASVMGAIAAHVHDFSNDYDNEKVEVHTVLVDNEPVEFISLFCSPHLVVEHGDPQKQIPRMLDIDDSMPVEKATIYNGIQPSVVLRGMDITKYRDSEDGASIRWPTDWDKWGPCNRPEGQPFVTPILKTLSGPRVDKGGASIVR